MNEKLFQIFISVTIFFDRTKEFWEKKIFGKILEKKQFIFLNFKNIDHSFKKNRILYLFGFINLKSSFLISNIEKI